MAIMMQTQQFGDILAFQTPEGQYLGFHHQNMEVAELSPEAWQSLQSHQALPELKAWNSEINPDVKSGQVEFGIRALTLNVTQICNLHCTYCAAGGDGTYGDPVRKISVEKTLPQLDFFLARVPAGESFSINFLGGEPLLYPEALELIAAHATAESEKRGIKVRFNIVTNGTLFSEKNIAILSKIHADITISCDGPPEIQDQFRPSKNGTASSKSLIEGLERLLQNKNRQGSIGFTGVFGPHNLQLRKSYEFYRSFNVDWYEFTYDHSQSTPEASQQYLEQLGEIAKIAYSEGGEAALRQIKVFDHYFHQLDSQQKTENFCGAGKSYLSIDSRNNLYTCPWLVGQKDEIVGTQTTLFSDRLKPYEPSLTKLNSCQSCWANTLCGGGCMFIHKNRTGSKHKVDSEFCNRTRDLILLALSYYQQSRK